MRRSSEHVAVSLNEPLRLRLTEHSEFISARAVVITGRRNVANTKIDRIDRVGTALDEKLACARAENGELVLPVAAIVAGNGLVTRDAELDRGVMSLDEPLPGARTENGELVSADSVVIGGDRNVAGLTAKFDRIRMAVDEPLPGARTVDPDFRAVGRRRNCPLPGYRRPSRSRFARIPLRTAGCRTSRYSGGRRSGPSCRRHRHRPVTGCESSRAETRRSRRNNTVDEDIGFARAHAA